MAPYKGDQLAICNGYSKLNSPVLLATPTTVQFTSSTGDFNLIKAAFPATLLTTLHCVNNNPSSTRQSNWRVQWTSIRQLHWQHPWYVSKLGQTRQWLLRVTYCLRKKRHHAGITLETNQFHKYVSKSNP